MPTSLLDKALSLQLDIMRVDADLRAQVIEILKQMERELIAQVAAGVSDWTKARIAQQISEAESIIRKYYDQAAGVSIDTTTGIYQISATQVGRSIGVVIGADAAPVLPGLAAMQALAGDSIIMGATQSAWWSRQAGDVAWRFSTAVRQGLAAAETNAAIIRRVRNEMEITRANAAALVQTSVQTVANDARLETMRANPAGILGLQWVATLDNHTCMQCGPRDGMTWNLDGSVKTATLPFINPPLHFNCRCVMVPLTRFSGLGNPQRASMDGPVPASTTFDEFLKRKGVAFQNEVLGEGRAQLWRDGKITLQDLVTSGARPLTLDQLRARYD